MSEVNQTSEKPGAAQLAFTGYPLIAAILLGLVLLGAGVYVRWALVKRADRAS